MFDRAFKLMFPLSTIFTTTNWLRLTVPLKSKLPPSCDTQTGWGYAVLIACYTVPVAQDAILVTCDGLKIVSTLIVSWPKSLKHHDQVQCHCTAENDGKLKENFLKETLITPKLMPVFLSLRGNAKQNFYLVSH